MVMPGHGACFSDVNVYKAEPTKDTATLIQKLWLPDPQLTVCVCDIFELVGKYRAWDGVYDESDIGINLSIIRITAQMTVLFGHSKFQTNMSLVKIP